MTGASLISTQYFMLNCTVVTGSFAFQLSIIGMLNILIAQLSQALPPDTLDWYLYST